MIERIEVREVIEEASPVYFHNLIYAAVDYAAELGFKTPDDFYLAEYVLDPDFIDDGIDDIELGRDGKPFYIQGSYDDPNLVMSILNLSVGPGGYDFFVEV